MELARVVRFIRRNEIGDANLNEVEAEPKPKSRVESLLQVKTRMRKRSHLIRECDERDISELASIYYPQPNFSFSIANLKNLLSSICDASREENSDKSREL